MKLFTEADVQKNTSMLHGPLQTYFNIYCDRNDLCIAELDWQKQGLQETQSGYGESIQNTVVVQYGNASKKKLKSNLTSN